MLLLRGAIEVPTDRAIGESPPARACDLAGHSEAQRPADGPRTAGSPTSARRPRTFARQPLVEPSERARFAARLIVILAVVGTAAPALVSASMAPPVAPPVSQLGAPPSAKPTHRPKATPPPVTVTPAPTAAPTVAPTPAPTRPPAAATPKPAATTESNATPAPPPATALPAGVGPPEPSASATAGAGGVVSGGGDLPGIEGSGSPLGGFGPVLGAGAALAALGFWVVFARRRRRSPDSGPDGTIGSDAAVPVSVDALTAVPPRPRAIDGGDEENMPRWLRPSVRAERFSGYQTRGRATIGGSAPEAPIEAAPIGAAIDLDALFASRRSSEPGLNPPGPSTTRRRAAPS